MAHNKPVIGADAAARDLSRSLAVATAPMGTILCEAGDRSPDALLVVSGVIESAQTGEVHTRQLVVTDHTTGRFTDTVRARTDVRFARVPQAGLAGAAHDPDAVADMLLQRLWRRELVVSASALFGELDAEFLARIEETSSWIEMKRGEVLIRQGEAGDQVYVVLTGRLQAVHERPDGTVQVVGNIAAGETVGEMSFFTGEPRSATVTAVRDSLLIGLTRQAVDDLLASRPGAARHVMRVQIERVHRANAGTPARAQLANIAVVALDDQSSTRDFGQHLASALRAFGRVVHLDAATVEATLHRPGLADSADDSADASRVSAWLDELERSARFVVYDTDGRHTGWLARSIRRADCIVLVGSAKSDPAPTACERIIAAEEGTYPAAQRMLVLLHESDGLPSQTARWLRGRMVTRHHHVRVSRAGDVDRVARFIAGQAIGLVLGAGGARGLAHIGVLRVLQEAGVAIDLVGGTSMGAAIAAQYAMGWTPDRISRTADEVWNRIRPHTEYTLPLLSLVRGRSAQRCGEMMYGSSTDIEDLWIPFFCVSSDLTDAAMRIHRTGSLLQSVTASSSLPAVIVPTHAGDHLLCDGSLFNTLPVNVARGEGCGTVMASRVSVSQDAEFRYDRIPTLGDVLRSKLTRRPIRYPGIMGVLLRSSMLAAIERENREAQAADLLFAPPLEQFGLMDFAALHTIVEAGYGDARRRYHEWEEAGALARIPRSGPQ